MPAIHTCITVLGKKRQFFLFLSRNTSNSGRKGFYRIELETINNNALKVGSNSCYKAQKSLPRIFHISNVIVKFTEALTFV